ncbi:hypothetical protein NDU88_003051 [Pleurodeles waltl]|uniref:Uncharacterized protein n=1 Tax=Pleurodeles waltl TaxID=8319 RepID=A0AAV7V079_PLEWA|nr:hypothetical protein NDU88_003051 [Pleurodeles waltl]
MRRNSAPPGVAPHGFPGLSPPLHALEKAMRGEAASSPPRVGLMGQPTAPTSPRATLRDPHGRSKQVRHRLNLSRHARRSRGVTHEHAQLLSAPVSGQRTKPPALRSANATRNRFRAPRTGSAAPV